MNTLVDSGGFAVSCPIELCLYAKVSLEELHIKDAMWEKVR